MPAMRRAPGPDLYRAILAAAGAGAARPPSQIVSRTGSTEADHAHPAVLDNVSAGAIIGARGVDLGDRCAGVFPNQSPRRLQATP